MPGVMLDTNIFGDASYRERVRKIPSLVTSAVVVQELLVIATKEQQVGLKRDFQNSLSKGTAFVPDHTDWLEVGRCLNRLHKTGVADFAKLSKEEVNLLVRDALIARTAIRAGAILVTINTTDFWKIKSVLPSLKFKSASEFFGVRSR